MRGPPGARDRIAFHVNVHGISVAEPSRRQTPTGADATLPRVRRLLATSAVVFAVACAVFAIARAQPHPPYPKAQAVAAAQRNDGIRAALAGTGWDSARVIPLDRSHWRVAFFAGPREVLDAAVDPRGGVDAVEVHKEGLHPPGSATLWSPALLAFFAGLFIAAVATQPLLSLRNLDALVVGGGFTMSALLLDDRLVAAHVYVGALALAYVAVRCAITGFAVESRELRPLAAIDRYVPWVTAS